MKVKRLFAFAVVVAACLVAVVPWAKRVKAQTVATLHSFCSEGARACTDGAGAHAGLVQGEDGNLYGTTEQGGDHGHGTIFRITPSGRLTTLYSFCPQDGCPDGSGPQTGLIQGSDDNFYGTTQNGGASGKGTVFKITPSGKLTTLYSFCSQDKCADGRTPYAGLVQGKDGNFYGTTEQGGAHEHGTIFKITPAGALTTVHSFCSQGKCADGSTPYAGLVQGKDGNFYGTTQRGGTKGNGTAFKVTPDGAVTTLHSFCSEKGCTDGAAPFAALVEGKDGSLYGAAAVGAYASGTIFKITPDGTLTTLHSFCPQPGCWDGSHPAGPIQATDGNLYGTTNSGGVKGWGSVFRLTPSGTLTTLYSFCPHSPGCEDGSTPVRGLIQGRDGTFYGTTLHGGAMQNGTVFSLFTARVSPASLSFGTQDVGTASPPQTVTLHNTSAAPLAIAGIEASGNFAQTNDCASSVAAGASCSIKVTFRPTATDTRRGRLTVTDNNNGLNGSRQTVALIGNSNPGASLSPPSLVFGAHVLGTRGVERKLTLASSGTTTLIISNIAIRGANAADFAQTNTCPPILAPGVKCVINIAFSPGGQGMRTASLEVNDNAVESPHAVVLSGNAILPVVLIPPKLLLRVQGDERTSVPRPVTLKSNLDTPLAISSITASGDFAQSNDCDGSVPPKRKCTISVTFTPAKSGDRTGTLTVKTNALPPFNVVTSELTGRTLPKRR